MPTRTLAIALSCLLVQGAICIQCVSASSPEAKRIEFANRVKAEVEKLGVGKESRVSIRLRENAKIAGYVSEISEDFFVVTNPETGVSTSVPYPAVTKIKGQHIETGLRIALQVIVVTLGAILLWAIFRGPRD